MLPPKLWNSTWIVRTARMVRIGTIKCSSIVLLRSSFSAHFSSFLLKSYLLKSLPPERKTQEEKAAFKREVSGNQYLLQFSSSGSRWLHEWGFWSWSLKISCLSMEGKRGEKKKKKDNSQHTSRPGWRPVTKLKGKRLLYNESLQHIQTISCTVYAVT